MWTAGMPILLKNNPGSGPEPGFIDKAAYSRYKRLHSQPAMQYPSNQPHSEHGWAFLRMRNARWARVPGTAAFS